MPAVNTRVLTAGIYYFLIGILSMVLFKICTKYVETTCSTCLCQDGCSWWPLGLAPSAICLHNLGIMWTT